MVRTDVKKAWVLIAMMLASSVADQARTPAHQPAEATASSRMARNGTNRSVSPEGVGLSSERLERIGRNIQKSIDENRIAGAVSLVARHGQIAYFKAFGMANRENRTPMRTDHIFRICSMTKPVTSVAVMMLYEEGRFSLERTGLQLHPGVQGDESFGSSVYAGQVVACRKPCGSETPDHNPPKDQHPT